MCTVFNMKTPVKTNETTSRELAWMSCRECGLDFYAPASPGRHEAPGNVLARRFGFCDLTHLGRYVAEIKTIIATR